MASFFPRSATCRGLPQVDKRAFIPRRRHQLQLVLSGQTLAVKKIYKGDRRGFLNEVAALHRLSACGCRVPALLKIDWDDLIIWKSYTPGRTLREELAQRGALVRDRDTVGAPNRQRLVAAETRRVMPLVADSALIDSVWSELMKVHGAGILLGDVKAGNIVMEPRSRQPHLIDFDYSRHLKRTNKLLARLIQDEDVEQYNQVFGMEKPTYRRIARAIADKTGLFKEIYAPVYIAPGLYAGALWSAEFGIGRWNYMLREHLRSPHRKASAGPGSNNGFNSLSMLRAGASQAVAFEKEDLFVRQGMFLKEAFEWKDGRRYDLQFVHGDMANLLVTDLGKFDIAMALCSLLSF